MIGRLAASLVLGAMPAQLAAQDRDCRTIQAMTNADGRDFADLRFGIGRPGISVRAGRGELGFANPEGCDLRSASDDASVSCQWHFADYTAAQAFYGQFLDRLRACLPIEVPQVPNNSSQPNYVIMRRNKAEDYRTPHWRVDLEVELVEYTYTPTPPATPGPSVVSYDVNLQIDYSPRDPSE
jgi:hypothetical protein